MQHALPVGPVCQVRPSDRRGGRLEALGVGDGACEDVLLGVQSPSKRMRRAVEEGTGGRWEG